MRSLVLLTSTLAICGVLLSALPISCGEWIQGHRAKAKDKLLVTFALKQRNVAALSQFVADVSNPKSPNYGNYMNLEEVSSLTDTRDNGLIVRNWLLRALKHHQIKNVGDFVEAKMTVGQAERVFSCIFFTWQNGNQFLIRTPLTVQERSSGAWKATLLPKEVREAVHSLLGVFDFPPIMAKRPLAFTPRHPDTAAHHKHVDSSLATKAKTNAPNLIGLLGSDTAIYVQFEPLCKDSSVAGPDLCATSAPPAIEAFQLTQKDPSGSVLAKSNLGCGPNTSKRAAQGGVICQDKTETPSPFVLVNVSLVTLYSDGSISAVASGGDAILTTPFVDVSLLNIFYGLPANNSINRRFSAYAQSAVEFSHNYFGPQELDSFFQYNKLSTDVGVTIHGPNNPNDPEGEADQDMQWIMGSGVQIDTVFWSTKNKSGFVLDWLKEVSVTPDHSVPRVFSISYGNPEKLTAEMFGKGYMERSEVEFAKLAARGISVTVADGDSGASNGLGCENGFFPDWPASSPHVTSCGGSTISSYSLPSTAVAVGTRTGVAYTTGGGFSSVFPRPNYQDQAVSDYLKDHKAMLPPDSMFNSSSRAFPDVSVLGYNLLSFYFHQNWVNPFPGGGTSFAAPIMAGMISRWNIMRHSAGKPPMGLVNPWLYQVAASNPETFYDIRVGDNACVGFGTPCCKHGYYCVKGYDAVSGLGSPYFHELSKHVNEPFKTVE